jgi:hypothetical protein
MARRENVVCAKEGNSKILLGVQLVGLAPGGAGFKKQPLDSESWGRGESSQKGMLLKRTQATMVN